MTLSKAEIGSIFEIQQVNGENCERLRDLGFCEKMQIHKITDGRNLICCICGAKTAISRELANDIDVFLIV